MDAKRDESRIVSLFSGQEDIVSERSESSSCSNSKGFESYIGQDELKKRLALYIKSSLIRCEPMDHVLIYGPPGLGKTTLASVIAHELGSNFKTTSAPAIEKVGDLVALLTALAPKDVFFIDEIHRLPKHIEEVLYSAMEGFFIDVVLGQGVGAKSIKLPVNKFTLIGATTKVSMVSAPLQTRFGIVEKIDFYPDQALADIIRADSEAVRVTIEPLAALEIAKRSRGTPRVAKRIFRRVFDYCLCSDLQEGQSVQQDLLQVQNSKAQKSEISLDLVKRALDFIGVDSMGLDLLDRKVLAVLYKSGIDNPMGLETIAGLVGEERETIEDYCEPFLMRIGLIEKTSRGRKIARDKFAFLSGQLGLKFNNEI